MNVNFIVKSFTHLTEPRIILTVLLEVLQHICDPLSTFEYTTGTFGHWDTFGPYGQLEKPASQPKGFFQMHGSACPTHSSGVRVKPGWQMLTR